MLVTTAMIGDRRRNEPSLSSASATRILALPEPGVGAERAQLAADDDGGIAARLAQHGADERGGGGLAVRAGDGDAVLHAHQLGEHLGARDHRDLELARAHDLGIRERHRGRDDEHVDALVDVRRHRARR